MKGTYRRREDHGMTEAEVSLAGHWIDVRNFCCVCIIVVPPGNSYTHMAPLGTMKADYLMQIVAVDIL